MLVAAPVGGISILDYSVDKIHPFVLNIHAIVAAVALMTTRRLETAARKALGAVRWQVNLAVNLEAMRKRCAQRGAAPPLHTRKP